MSRPSIGSKQSLPRRSLPSLLWLGFFVAYGGCDDELPPLPAGSAGSSSGTTATQAESTGAPPVTSGTDPTSDPGSTEGPSSADSTTGGPPDPTTGSSGPDPSGGSSTGGLELEGDPPAPASYTAVDDGDFTLLGDNDDFTNFSDNGNRVQILPLRDENFPPGVDYCTVGSDAQLNDLQQWARAQLQPTVPKTWYYDVTITAVAEEDGESEFALVVNGEIVDTMTTPVTDRTPGVGDMDDYAHIWEGVPLFLGDTIEIWGKAHSNLGLEEGAGCRNWSPTYAWARGRWRLLDLAPTPGVE